MSEFYWPETPGVYEIQCGDGESEWWTLIGGLWAATYTTQQMIDDGYLGVRREPAKAEPAYYWPDEPGDYTLCGHGGCKADARWDGRAFMFSDGEAASVSTLRKFGWFGVAREPEATPVDDNATYAASVMAKLRAAKKPGQFEAIALGDVPELCRRLGAR
jgi:hypothetical protein